ncbi:AraC family transcriptional regulator, partial [Acinetobacter baumannii]|nr:AraC family transcriptional regulator [Acinetobacter baumannii]
MFNFFEQGHGAPWFPQAVIQDLGLSQQLCLLFDLLEQKDNFLLK